METTIIMLNRINYFLFLISYLKTPCKCTILGILTDKLYSGAGSVVDQCHPCNWACITVRMQWYALMATSDV